MFGHLCCGLHHAASGADTGYNGTAVGTGSIAKPVGADGITVTLYQQGRTGGAPSIFSPLAGHVAFIASP